MHILIVINTQIPALKYGGTQRVAYALGKEFVKKGHKVTFLAGKDSYADFATVLEFRPELPLRDQIPSDVDVVHFNIGFSGKPDIDKPYIITMHGNSSSYLDENTVFLSGNHAERNHATCFVYNGLDWDEYDTPGLNNDRKYYHYLAKAAWRLKNVKGAISIINNLPNGKLEVLGGTRLNFKMGFRMTLSRKINFHGMVGDKEKSAIMNHSKGLIFPVLWHEPFGLAIIESLYFGCPVFATPYGSLPELVHKDVGFLSNSKEEFISYMKEEPHYSAKVCHEYARDLFNSRVMAENYLEKYEIVLSGKTLNPVQPIAGPSERNLPFL